VGLRLGGLPTVAFVVKTARSNQNKSLAVAQCRSQCSAVFCSAIFPATSPRYSVRSSLLAARNHIPYRPIILLLTTLQRPFTSSFLFNPHRQRLLPLPAL
jgi:hypothetical protein